MVFHGCIDTVVVILSDWPDDSAEMIENMKKWPGVVSIRLLLKTLELLTKPTSFSY